MYKGESYTIELSFVSTYDTGRIEELQLFIGDTLIGKLSDGSIIGMEEIYRCEIEGITTDTIQVGTRKLHMYLLDSIRGVLNKQIAKIYVLPFPNTYTDQSINLETNLLLEVDPEPEEYIQVIDITI